MSIGYSNYPDGIANDPAAPWDAVEGPCDVCGLPYDDCICPECPECGEQGDPICYEKHGLALSDEQRQSKERVEREAAENEMRLIADYQKWMSQEAHEDAINLLGGEPDVMTESDTREGGGEKLAVTASTALARRVIDARFAAGRWKDRTV